MPRSRSNDPNASMNRQDGIQQGRHQCGDSHCRVGDQSASPIPLSHSPFRVIPLRPTLAQINVLSRMTNSLRFASVCRCLREDLKDYQPGRPNGQDFEALMDQFNDGAIRNQTQ